MSDRMVPVQGSRVELRRLADGIAVQMPRRRSWTVWLIPVWTLFVVGFGVVSMLTFEGPDEPPLAFLGLWLAIGAFMLCVASWGLLAREELRLDRRALTREMRLGPLRRRRSWAREAIEDVRVSPESMSAWDFRTGLRMYGIGGGVIAFDYGSRTIRVADTEEAEAKRIVEALRAEGLG